MKLVFAGTPDIAVPALAALLESGHEVLLVVTQPDRRAGRGRKVLVPPVKALAVSRGVPVIQPESVNQPDVIARLRELAPDALVVMAYGLRVRRQVLGLPRLGCFNIHTSLLPKYRGAAPVAHAILNGETETGVTVQRMALGIDTGPVLAGRAIRIGADETAGELAERLAVVAAEVIVPTLDAVEAGAATERPQDAARASRAPKLVKSDGLVPWDRDARQVFDFVRAMTPWPGAFTFHHTAAGAARGRLILLAVKVAESADAERRDLPGTGAKPGMVLRADEELVVAAARGGLCLVRVKPEGGKPMDAAAYLRGRSIRVGDRFRGPS